MSTDPHHKVVGLDVAVDEILAVHVFDITEHLVGKHQNSLHRQATRAEIEQILQARSEQLHYHNIVVLGLAEPAHMRNAHATLQDLVEFALVQQLRVTRFQRLQLHSHLLAVRDVYSQIYITKRSASYLTNKSILGLCRVTDQKVLFHARRRQAFLRSGNFHHVACSV